MDRNQELPFEDISKTPTELTATNTLLRVVEGLAFRYRWATENLREENIKFRPHSTSMSIEEVNSHIFDLVDSTFTVFGGEKQNRDAQNSFQQIRKKSLFILQDLSERLKEMSDKDLSEIEKNTSRKLPFWYWINGPLADALTHVGQITSWRRIAGNPQLKGVNVFIGTSDKVEKY
ncbi:hypothetical protein OAD79_02155 [Flavobacteriales bacterium]|nr:hypothetical protein [Flavobacteriales bacterium]